MVKVGIVVQRYGNDVVGGAETLARDIAQRLNAAGCDVTVFTTTSRDYISWENHYQPGETILKGVIIKRFPVEKSRNIDAFNLYSDHFFLHRHSPEDEMTWIKEQGPYCPLLIDALKKQQHLFDLFIFFTYLYYPTVEGLKAVNKPALLFTTAHDEAPIHLDMMRQVFSRPQALLFLTRSEMELVKRIFSPKNHLVLIGTGVDIKEIKDSRLFRQKYGLYAPYMLYAGRIEKGKGLELVFDQFQSIYKQRLIDLVLIGKKIMDMPKVDRIRYLGFISEEEKLMAFKEALFSLQPSPRESLSITTLESFSQHRPVLANRESAVLVEHVENSGGGLIYSNGHEWQRHFFHLYDQAKSRQEMGDNGFCYLKENYSWDRVIDKINRLLAEVTGN